MTDPVKGRLPFGTGYPLRAEGQGPFGRALETGLLEAALERACRGGRELLFLRGESGIGKTALAESLKPRLRSRGLLGSGKFEPGRRQEPLFALMGAIRGMIRTILLLPERQLAQRRAALQIALEGLGGVLLPFLPELAHVLGPQTIPPALGPAENQHRFNFLFGRLMNTLGGIDPLVLFLDDLQWADSASLDLLQNWIGSVPTDRGCFFLAAFRTPADADLGRFFAELEGKGFSPTYVDLHPLDEDAVGAWVDSVFENAADVKHSLGKAILQGTRGHPFHIHQYLDALRQHRYVEFDPSGERWMLCFRDSVPPESVVPSRHLLFLTLAKLSDPTRACLETAACAGFTFSPGLVATVMGCTASELTGLIDEGMRWGLITVPESGSSASPATAYAFTHDQVAEALLEGISEERSQLIHLALGMRLLESPQDTEVEIFAICGHLNRAHDLIQEGTRRRQASELNLRAGRKAKSSAAFGEGFKYCKAGLALLPADAWSETYELSMALYQEAAETAYMSGDFEAMEVHVMAIEKHARSFLDFTPAGEILIQSLASRHRFKETIDYGLSMLSRYGLTFPSRPGKGSALLAILSAEWAVSRKSFRAMEEQGLGVDMEKLAIARIISHINAVVFLSRPDLHPLILIAQLKLSLRYGVNRFTPFAYGVYGFIQCGVLRRYGRGYRFGQLALNLLQRHGFVESAAKVLFVVNHFIRPWKVSLEETLPGLKEGLTDALKSGDIEFAGYLANVYGMHLYHSGANLEKLRIVLLDHQALIAGLSQGRSLLLQNLYVLSADSLLQLRPLEAAKQASDSMREELKAGNDAHGAALWYLNRMILCVVGGDCGAALAAGAEVRKRLESFTGLFFTGWYHFYDALAISGLETPEYGHRRRFNHHLRRIRSFAEKAPGNYRHKSHLLAAESYRMRGRPMQAREEYILAIESSRGARALDEEALAWERLFLFHHNRGERGFACIQLREHIACLRRWGAEAKVAQVFGRYKSEYPQACRDPAGFSGANQDFRKIFAISQSLSLEMDMDKLMITLMDAIVDLSGATRVCLVSTAAEGLRILAEKGKPRALMQMVGSRDSLPGSVLVFVTRTGQKVNLADAEADEQFGWDPYFKNHECKSVLCFPLKSQGKTEALLYLENPNAVDAFSGNDPWTEWVGGQAAISLRNAQFHRQRMTALKARINPHFLFNALTSISETILDEPKDAVRGVAKLSKLYRYLLQSSDRDLVPLEREMEFVDVYVSIEKLRYGGRLNFRRDVQEGLGELLIPPLTVQPLIENAIKHGLAPKTGGGTVTLQIRTQGGFCRISVSDDGVGWGGGKPGTGEGHRNIFERLSLAFGDRARLDFFDATGTASTPGTVVEAVIWIPLGEAREN